MHYTGAEYNVFGKEYIEVRIYRLLCFQLLNLVAMTSFSVDSLRTRPPRVYSQGSPMAGWLAFSLAKFNVAIQ